MYFCQSVCILECKVVAKTGRTRDDTVAVILVKNGVFALVTTGWPWSRLGYKGWRINVGLPKLLCLEI